jgi:hypothetical protein
MNCVHDPSPYGRGRLALKASGERAYPVEVALVPLTPLGLRTESPSPRRGEGL